MQLIQKQFFPENRFLSRYDSRVQSDSAGVNNIKMEVNSDPGKF